MSRTSLGLAVAAALSFGGLAMSTAPAAAAPMLDPGVASTTQNSNVEKARIVCNRWGRCWRRPNVWGPRFYGGGWRHHGWRGRHHGWGHRGGWRHRGRW